MPRLFAIAKRVEGEFERGVNPKDLETFQRVLVSMLSNTGEALTPRAFNEDHAEELSE